MTSRKPPSQRDAEYTAYRQGRSIQSMVPGTVQGRIANARPTSSVEGFKLIATGSALSTGGSEAAETVFFQRDRFPAFDTITTPNTFYTLSYEPILHSLHVYLNGQEQKEGTDYGLDGKIILISEDMQVSSGDVIDARYAFDEDNFTPPVGNGVFGRVELLEAEAIMSDLGYNYNGRVSLLEGEVLISGFAYDYNGRVGLLEAEVLIQQ